MHCKAGETQQGGLSVESGNCRIGRHQRQRGPHEERNALEGSLWV